MRTKRRVDTAIKTERMTSHTDARRSAGHGSGQKRISLDNEKRALSSGLPRKALTRSSSPWEIRLTSHLETPLAPPRASAFRVEMPPV